MGFLALLLFAACGCAAEAEVDLSASLWQLWRNGLKDIADRLDRSEKVVEKLMKAADQLQQNQTKLQHKFQELRELLEWADELFWKAIQVFVLLAILIVISCIIYHRKCLPKIEINTASIPPDDPESEESLQFQTPMVAFSPAFKVPCFQDLRGKFETACPATVRKSNRKIKPVDRYITQH